MSTRRDARERVLQALYAAELSGDQAQHVIDTVLAPPFGKDRDGLRFAERLFLKTLDHAVDTDALVQKHAQNWDIGRMAVLDRLVLRMAVTELLYLDEVPPKVTLNEALEVAKKFSTDKSGPFVNGILDALLRELRKEGRITKRGRGLVETTLPPA